MKTTFELPDHVFRRAKSKAAERGIPLRQLLTEAVEKILREPEASDAKPWMKSFGKLKHLRKETGLIDKLIEEEFEKIEPEMCK